MSDRECLNRAALAYHEFPTPGKISIAPTKRIINQRDLAFEIRRFGVWPKAALRSHSDLGRSESSSAVKMTAK